jgi:hypothetical protein
LTPAGSRADRVTRELKPTGTEPEATEPAGVPLPPHRDWHSDTECTQSRWGQLPLSARRPLRPAAGAGTFKVGPGAQAMIDQSMIVTGTGTGTGRSAIVRY